MNKLLLLVRGDGRQLIDLQGRCVLRDLPFPVLVFIDQANAHHTGAPAPDIEVEVVRWSDLAGVRARAERHHAAAPLLGLAALDEKMVDFAAELRQALGLPGMHCAASRRFRDKLTMKSLLDAAGIRVPAHARCDDEAAVRNLLAIHQRIVIKPVDGLGSRDVEFIDTPQGLAAWRERQDRLDAYEAEEYIDGVLYHLNAVVRDGMPVLTACAIYLPGMANIDFASGAPFVSVLVTDEELHERLRQFSDQVLAVLGMENGVTHLECFVKADNEIVFCETAARPGGGGIVLMIEAQYGINYARALLLLEGGRGDLIAPDPAHGRVAGLIGFRNPDTGFIKRIAPRERFSEPWIRHVHLPVAAGGFVPAAAHCTDFIGLLIFNSRDRAEFEQKRIDLYQRFYAELETTHA